MKPKLLVVTSTFPRWSNDTDPPFVYELSKRLTGNFEITIHTPHYPGAKAKEIMDGMHVHRFRYFFPPFNKLAGSTGILPTLRTNKLYVAIVPFFLLAQFFSLLFLIQKDRPDVIHAHWIIPQGFVTAILQIFSKVPVVITAHGADVFGLQGTLFSLVKRFTLKKCKKLVVVSKALAEALLPFTESAVQTKVIPMGVDSSIFTPNRRSKRIREEYATDGPFLLYVGRLTEKKGVCYLIAAMELVIQKIPNTKLLIIGNGELEQELKQQVKQLKLDDQILLIGSISNKDLPEYYASADIFIGPSVQVQGGDREGFGLTLVEAAMSGCPVIASDSGGITDIVQDSRTGFLVPPGDVNLLAERIIHVIRHTGCQALLELRSRGRQNCVELYDWSVISNRYIIILKDCIRHQE